MYDPGVTSRFASRMRHYWSRTTVLGRDGWRLCRAMVGEIRGTQDQRLGDAFRNVLVTQARQSDNQMATSLLALQQRIGLVQYHGVVGYLRQWQQKRLGHHNSSSGPSAIIDTTTTGVGNNSNAGNINNNVAQVAFMITGSMREKLTLEMGYEADRIKKMTPTDASLILHHKLSPEQVDAQLPGLVQRHEAEQKRIQHEQQRSTILKQQREKEEERMRQEQQKAEAIAQQEAGAQPEDGQRSKSLPAHTDQAVDNKADELLRMKQQEGLYQLDPPTVPFSPQPQIVESTVDATNSDAAISSTTTTDDAPLGSFVRSMEAAVDASQQVWYEIVETRLEDNSEVAVALFSNKEEAEIVLDLKQTFAKRRAHEDKDNPNNEPAWTYRIQTTLR